MVVAVNAGMMGNLTHGLYLRAVQEVLDTGDITAKINAVTHNIGFTIPFQSEYRKHDIFIINANWPYGIKKQGEIPENFLTFVRFKIKNAEM
jgi:hypothetical protein